MIDPDARGILFVQDVIARDKDEEIARAAETLGLAHVPFSLAGRSIALFDPQDLIRGPGLGPDMACFVFCSLPVAQRIRRKGGTLSSGLSLNPAALRWSSWASRLPAEMLLNPRGVLVPWAHVEDTARSLAGGCPGFPSENGTPGHFFLRPDSAMKPFPGQAIEMEDLEASLSAIGQIHHVAPEEPCLIAPARDLPRIEHRIWTQDGEVIGAASYDRLGEDHAERPAPEGDVLDAAGLVARAYEDIEPAPVLDFVRTETGPRLVEMNALSTSGFYPGLDVLAFLERLVEAAESCGAV